MTTKQRFESADDFLSRATVADLRSLLNEIYQNPDAFPRKEDLLVNATPYNDADALLWGCQIERLIEIMDPSPMIKRAIKQK